MELPVNHFKHALQAGKPQIGAFGFDEAGMDRSIAPGDDFYNYANGTWAKTTAIPADKSSFGAFDTLADLSRDRTRGILEAAAKQPGSKIGTAYATYLDTGAIEALCRQVIEANPKAVGEYKGGKTGSINFLKGQVMKLSKGKANPAAVGEILERKLRAQP